MSCEVQNYELVFLTDYQLPLHIIHLKIIMGIHPLANCRRHAAHHKILLQEIRQFCLKLVLHLEESAAFGRSFPSIVFKSSKSNLSISYLCLFSNFRILPQRY